MQTRSSSREEVMMILYLCLGIIVIGIGFVTIFFVVKEEENVFRAIPGEFS